MNCRHIFAVATCLCLFALAAAAAPTTLPAPFFNGSTYYNVTNTTVTISSPGTYPNGPISAVANAYPNAASYLSAGCGFAYPDVCSPGGALDIVYYFTVTGGNIGDTVTVDVNAALRAATTSSNVGSNSLVQTSASIAVSVNSNVFSQSLANGCVGACSYSNTWVGTFTVPMLVGDVASIDMNTLVSLWEGAPGASGSAIAYADPYIYIDPNTPNAGLYGIVVSPGVGNSPLGSTPEPSSLMLLGSGVIGVAGLVRRKFLR